MPASSSEPSVDDRAADKQARLEKPLQWRWTETGFAVTLPQLKPDHSFPIIVAVFICLAVAVPLVAIGYSNLDATALGYWFVYAVMMGAAFGVWSWVDPLGLFDQESPVSLASDPIAPPIRVEARGDVLWLADERVELAAIDHVMFSSGRLRVRYGDEVWASAEVPAVVHESVEALLVPWLHRAVANAHRQRKDREAEAHALRRATHRLRARATEPPRDG